MLKHVQISPLRNRSDSVSLRSSCASSICGSPEPPTELQRTPSRASSYSSLSEQLPQTTIKVFTNCLKIDIEYKTLGMQWDTTSREVITQLLRRLKMRHRDPRLFYLSMEVSVRRAGVKTILVLDDDTRPAILQACHPKGESRFCLQLKPGGLIRVHTSALQPSSQYKSLVISEETTSDELLQLLLSCYNSMEPVEQFSIYEVCPGQEYQRKLHPDDIPLRAQSERMRRGETCHFLVRRNPTYIRRRQLLATLNGLSQNGINNNNSKSFDANSTVSSLEDDSSLLDISIESLTDDIHSLMASDEDEDGASSTSGSSDTSSEGSTGGIRRTPSTLSVVPLTQHINAPPKKADVCPKCRNTFKSCEFCHKNSSMMLKLQRSNSTVSNSSCATTKTLQMHLPSYSPVYNIREIRTATHSFSALGNDKKLLDIELNGRFDTSACQRLRPQSVCVTRSTRMLADGNGNAAAAVAAAVSEHQPAVKQTGGDFNGNNATTSAAAAATVGGEVVNNHPAKGLGHFVYL